MDYSRGVNARVDLQDATDAAALGMLKLPDATAAELDAAALGIVLANLGEGLKLENVTVAVERAGNGSIVVEADIDLSPYFMQISGFTVLTADARSVAASGGGASMSMSISWSIVRPRP